MLWVGRYTPLFVVGGVCLGLFCGFFLWFGGFFCVLWVLFWYCLATELLLFCLRGLVGVVSGCFSGSFSCVLVFL